MKKALCLLLIIALLTPVLAFAASAPVGYYKGPDGTLLLLEDGSAIIYINGYADWTLRWDDQAIYSETGSPGWYTYADGHLSFGWEGGDGYYTYEYDYCPEKYLTAPAGYYTGDIGSLELSESGTGTLSIGGYDEPIRWDDRLIYSEYDLSGHYIYADGKLSFAWEGGEGGYVYTFNYMPEGRPEALIGDFFDVVNDEPYFVYRSTGKHYGYEDDYWEGCSVWCAVQDYSVSTEASSTLAPQGKFSYYAKNITNGDRNNAWIEGADGYGIYEYIDITRRYSVTHEKYGVDYKNLCIVNGYAQTEAKWKANSRVKALGMYMNGEFITTLPLLDIMEPQYFDLTPYHLHADSGADTVFRFEICQVYPGDKYEDTAITGIEFQFMTPNH